MARVTGITQYYLPPTRLSTNGMNRPAFTPYAFTRWHHRSEVAHIRLTAHYSLINLERLKGWVGLVGWPCSGRFTHIGGHPSAAGRAYRQEKFAGHRLTFHHCATQPRYRVKNEYEKQLAMYKFLPTQSNNLHSQLALLKWKIQLNKSWRVRIT